MLRRFLTSYPLWSLMLAFAAATRGTSYLALPSTSSEAFVVVRGLASMHSWGWAFCVLAAGCVAGMWSRWVSFWTHATLGVFLNLLLAVGLGYQSITQHTPWTTVGQVASFALLHGTIAVHVLPPKRPRPAPPSRPVS